MRTIPEFESCLYPFQKILCNDFIPTLFGQTEPLPDYFERALSLPQKDGGIAIPNVIGEAEDQLKRSTLITGLHVNAIVEQKSSIIAATDGETTQHERKKEVMRLRREKIVNKVESALNQLLDKH